ncbi:MAG TPA: Ku protein [Thermoanaerobaculia bacterium]|jgi:DNA end-binding protein Ku|nr:Ku protein [Thermoanaerobaculia bacterium]
MANGSRGRHHAKRSHESGDGAGGPRALWSGTISFGLVSVPVELYAANRRGRPGLRWIAPSGLPVQRRYAASEEGKEVGPAQLIRGYEVAPNEHVIVTDAELEALLPEKSRDIDLTRFVPVDEVDPVLFERAYYLAPGGESAKAYRLLADVMERTGRAGIATFVMRDKEYLVAIFSEGGILRAETLRFADEVRSAEDVGLPEPKKPKAAEVTKLKRAIAARSEKALDPEELVDPWTARIEALAEKKQKKGEDVVEVPEAAEEERAEVIDLMEVLKRSLGAGPARRTSGGERGATSRRAPAKASKAGTSRRRAGAARSRGTKSSHATRSSRGR